MQRTKPLPIVERIRELFNYDPETGIFTTKKSRKCGQGEAGRTVGAKDARGHLFARVDGKHFKLHRLAWVYMTGKLPENMIDHKDRVGDNNVWSNLRECTNGENQMNTGPQINNRLGVKNISQMKNGAFKATVQAYKKIHVQIFLDLEAAASWARQKRIELHGEFARHNTQPTESGAGE